jgi:DnaJ-class molecular chaperone
VTLDDNKTICPECGGQGYTMAGRGGYDSDAVDCLACHGTGLIPAPGKKALPAQRQEERRGVTVNHLDG